MSNRIVSVRIPGIRRSAVEMYLMLRVEDQSMETKWTRLGLGGSELHRASSGLIAEERSRSKRDMDYLYVQYSGMRGTSGAGAG